MDSCANIFEINKFINLNRIKYVEIWSFKTTIGLNNLNLKEELFVKKGYFFIIEAKSNALAIGDSKFGQDFKVDSNGTLFNLDPVKKFQILFSAQLKDSFYYFETSIRKFYDHDGLYDITLNLTGSKKFATKKVYVDKS